MDMRRTGPDEVVATFSYAEAVVLFELLHRWEDRGIDRQLELFEDKAEQVALWDLTASLEPIIDEVFSPTYVATLADARRQVRGPEG